MPSVIKPLSLFGALRPILVSPYIPELDLLVFRNTTQIPAILGHVYRGNPLQMPDEGAHRSQIEVLPRVPERDVAVVSAAQEVGRVVDWANLINVQVEVGGVGLEQDVFLCQVVKHYSAFISCDHYFGGIVLESGFKNGISLFTLE